MAGYDTCKRHDEPELHCRMCIEAETVAAIVAWLRNRATELHSRVDQRAAEAYAECIERGDWKPKPDGRRG